MLYHHQSSKYPITFLCSGLLRCLEDTDAFHCNQSILYHIHAAMSFQRLPTYYHSNATAYPPSNQPISPRRATDEADVSSEESDSDNDSEHLLDYNARTLHRRQIQARLRNRLQRAHDRINNVLQPVQNLTNGIAGHGDHIYNDVARPFFDEAMFQVHVIVLTIGRLLLGLLWFVLEVIWWTLWGALYLIGETVWLVCHTIWASANFVLDLLLRVVFAIPHILRDAPWHLLGYIPLAIVSGLVVWSVLHGFMRMTDYICDEPELMKNWISLSETCNSTQMKEVLRLQNKELNKLVHANDHVVYSISDMAGIGKPDQLSGYNLMRETTALVQFAKAHNDSLASFSKRHDFVAVANAVHSNVTAFNSAVDKWAFSHRFRLEELEMKVHKILADAKTYKAQTAYERWFSQSAFFLFPSMFSHTPVGHQSSHYVAVATRYLDDPQTAEILRQANMFELSFIRATQGLLVAREALKRYEPFWKNHCQQNGEAGVSGYIDCGVVDPSDLNERLEEALQETQVSVKKLNRLHKLHKLVNGGLMVLRTELVRLLRIAARNKVIAKGENAAAENKTITVKTAAAKKKSAAEDEKIHLNAASARAVLHQFVMEVGRIDLMIGYGTYTVSMAFDDSVARGSRHKKSADGTYEPILEKYKNQAQGDGSYIQGPWS